MVLKCVSSKYFDKETFYLGGSHVTIVNPNVHFPNDLTPDNINNFLITNKENYDSTYRELADISRELLSFTKDLSVHKIKIKKFLRSKSTAEVSAAANVSTTTINDIKKGKRSIETINMGLFEKLYVLSLKEEMNANNVGKKIQ